LSAVEARPSVVAVSGLTRDYGSGAGLFDLDLEIPRGSVFGLVGPNGAGKTTLLTILAGLRRAERGRVDIRAARSALCPDTPEFEPWLTAAEVVGFAGELRGEPVSAQRCEQVLSRMGLADAAHRRTKGFSRGMLQRLGLAATLVCRPDLVILDEPASGLDPQGRADVLDLVGGLRGETTVVFSSHLLADVERVCDDVAVLCEGRAAYRGPVSDLLSRYVTPTWHLKVRDGAHGLAETLAAEPWVLHARALGSQELTVEAVSVEAGERGIPQVLADGGHALADFRSQDAQLEAAVLALTGRGTR
jgi:ABC-2 type transport system ATP-binding protein